MSYSLRCDICDTQYGRWEFRNKFSFLEWHYCMGDGWPEKIDICDSCMEKFKQFVAKGGSHD